MVRAKEEKGSGVKERGKKKCNRTGEEQGVQRFGEKEMERLRFREKVVKEREVSGKNGGG